MTQRTPFVKRLPFVIAMFGVALVSVFLVLPLFLLNSFSVQADLRLPNPVVDVTNAEFNEAGQLFLVGQKSKFCAADEIAYTVEFTALQDAVVTWESWMLNIEGAGEFIRTARFPVNHGQDYSIKRFYNIEGLSPGNYVLFISLSSRFAEAVILRFPVSVGDC